MQAKGVKFQATKPDISVIDILRKMASKGMLEVREGSGSAPNQYKPKAPVTITNS